MEEKDVFHLIKNIQLFSTLTDEELHQISSKIKIKNFKKNEIILFREDTNEFMYIILSGKVRVIQLTEDGKETILAIHKAGEFFGEMSLIDGKTMPATVLATENTLTGIISKKDFYFLLYAQNKISDRLLQILSSRLRESWERIQILNFKNASQRMKTLFILLADKYGKKTNDGITLEIKLTHQDIANMAGITRETVTRVIDKWQKDNEITLLRKKYIHLPIDFLKKDLKIIS